MLSILKIQLGNKELVILQNSIKRIEHEYFSMKDNHSLSIIRSELHIIITKLFRIKSQGTEVNCEKKYLKEFIAFQNLVENQVSQNTKFQTLQQKWELALKS